MLVSCYNLKMLLIILLLWIISPDRLCCLVKDEIIVEIATVIGPPDPNSLGSIVYVGPAFDTGIAELREKYSDVFNLTHIYLRSSPSNILSCVDLQYNVVYAVAEHFHKRPRPYPDMTIFVNPGCGESDELNKILAQWNVLFITTVENLKNTQDRKKTTWLTTASVAKENFAILYQKVLARYNWTSLFFIYDENTSTLFSYTARTIAQVTSALAGTQVNFATFPSRKMLDWKPILEAFRKVSRVCLFFGSGNQFRNLLIQAASLEMINGEFVYMVYEPYQHPSFGDFNWNYGNDDDNVVRDAFRSVLKMSIDQSEQTHTEDLRYALAAWRNESRENYNCTYPVEFQPIPMMVNSYAAISILGTVLNETLQEADYDLSKGNWFRQRFINRTFQTKFGKIIIDNNGTRKIDMVVWDFNASSEQFIVAIKYSADTSVMQQVASIDWGSGTGNRAPLNEPTCGYLHNRLTCYVNSYRTSVYGAVFTTAGVGVICAVVCGFLLRKRLRMIMLTESSWWKLDENLLSDQLQYRILLRLTGLKFQTDTEIKKKNSDSCKTYAGSEVWAVELPGTYASSCFEQSNHAIKLQTIMANMRTIAHANVLRFCGLCHCQADQRLLILTEFCTKGSFNNLLENATEIDWELKVCFMLDLLAGLTFIHQSVFLFHGSLSGWNCLVDKHLTLKIADLGIDSIKQVLNNRRTQTIKPVKQIWQCPEVLRGGPTTQAGDVYSVAIVLYQIIAFRFPFSCTNCSGQTNGEIVARIMDGGCPPPRPNLDDEYCTRDLSTTIKTGWAENPRDRPSIRTLQENVRHAIGITHQHNGVAFTQIQKRLEKYAIDLEELVKERSAALYEETLKCEELLTEVLPIAILRKLRAGETVEAELFEAVTISFSGISDFASIVACIAPIEIFDFLNRTYTLFDDTLRKFDAYKVETISDSYMVASGVPLPNGNDHVRQICSFAYLMHQWYLPVGVDLRVSLKIGVHTGPCAAGVVGHLNPRYCLFGDSVNTAARMQTSGEPSMIQLSRSSADLLSHFPDFLFSERGRINVKGKGSMVTFWLNYAPPNT